MYSVECVCVCTFGCGRDGYTEYVLKGRRGGAMCLDIADIHPGSGAHIYN